MITRDPLADRFAIMDLLTRYATALDSKDWPLLATCFTADAEVVYGGAPEPLRGPTQVVPFCRRALDRYAYTQHLLGNAVIVLAGDRATSRISLQATHVEAGADPRRVFILAGTYEDSLVWLAGDWQIARRELKSIWTRSSQTG